MQNNLSCLVAEAKALEPNIIGWRRHLHAHPELSFQEYQTADYIRAALTEMGVSWTACTPTGTVALLGNPEHPCIALRADIDALPIAEESGVDFCSQNNGVMHACGHDAHTAMLLGAIKLLQSREQDLNVCVKCIFQPGEEKLPGGAKLMIEAGVLQNPTPVAIFGQHVYPFQEAGTISFAESMMMASADELYWEIRGKGGHAAQPHVAHDPILAMAHIITALQSVVSRTLNPLESGVLSVTAVEGGFATNVIPEKVSMKGTLRAMNDDWRNSALERINQHSTLIGRSFGVECSFNPQKGYPPLCNTPAVVHQTRALATELIGKEHILEFEPKMWGEDFAYFAQNVPACFWMLGVQPKQSEAFGLHHPRFLVQEEALHIGTAMMAAVALSYKI